MHTPMKEPIINLPRAALTINMYRIRHLFYILHINQPECWIAMNQPLDAWFDNKSTLILGRENLQPLAQRKVEGAGSNLKPGASPLHPGEEAGSNALEALSRRVWLQVLQAAFIIPFTYLLPRLNASTLTSKDQGHRIAVLRWTPV